MDRRTWLQLLSILATVRESQAQQRGGAQQQPMRIEKTQVVGALKLLGLEFEDAEIDMMMRGVNSAIPTYESLRKAEIPLDTEPAFGFRPGRPNREPVKGPQRFETTIPKSSPKPPSNLEDLAFARVVDLAPLIKSRAVSSTDLTKMYLERMKK